MAVWVITALEKYKSLNKYNLVEIGPGKGTMMADMI